MRGALYNNFFQNSVPSWVPLLGGVPADIYFNFKAGQAYGRQFSDISVIRASQKMTVNSTGAWTLLGNNVLPVSDTGVWPESQKTGANRNNTGAGAVIGTPGTDPNFWTIGSTAGLTKTVVGVGTENGLDYIEYGFAGVSSGTFIRIFMETATQIVASSGQTWTHSYFFKFTDLTQAPNSISCGFFGETAGGVPTADLPASVDSSLSTSIKRIFITATLADVTSVFVRPIFQVNVNNATAYNFKIRIYLSVQELGNFASSPMRMSNAAFVRAADILTLAGIPFNSSGSFMWKAQKTHTPAVNDVGLGISDGTIGNEILSYVNSGLNALVLQGTGITGLAAGAGMVTPGQRQRFAASWAPGGVNAAFNGAAIGAGNASVPSGVGMTTRVIGARGNLSFFYDDLIEEWALWNNYAGTRPQMATLTAT